MTLGVALTGRAETFRAIDEAHGLTLLESGDGLGGNGLYVLFKGRVTSHTRAQVELMGRGLFGLMFADHELLESGDGGPMDVADVVLGPKLSQFEEVALSGALIRGAAFAGLGG